MDRLLAYLLIGLTEGLLYGLLALGIVLVYKGTRVINFAITSWALVSAFIAWWLTERAAFLPFEQNTRPRYAVAAALAIGLAAVNGLGVHDIFRRLKGAPRLTLLVATLAIAAGNAGLVLLLFARNEQQANDPRSLPSFVTKTFTIGSKDVPGADIEVLILVPVLCALLALFFTRTRFGVAVRAAADNGDAARLLGISARRVSVFVWVTGAVLAAIAGLLITEHRRSLDTASLSTGFLLAGLIAALVGGLTSLPGAVVGGLVVGLLQALTSYLLPDEPGLPEVVLVVLIVGILIFRPQGLFGQREETEDRAAFVATLRALPSILRASPASAGYRAMGPVTAVFVVCLAFVTGPGTNQTIATIACYGIVGVSLTVLIGFTGQISLGHWGIVGFGAYVTAYASDRWDLPWLVSVVIGTAAGAAISFVLAIPSLRIRGLYLAVVTMAFHVAASQWLFPQIGGGTAGLHMDRPKIGPFNLDDASGQPLTLACIAALGLAMIVASNVGRSRVGRSLLAVRENEKAAATLGIGLTQAKFAAFSISGGIAGLAGAMYVTLLELAEPTTWDLARSFTLVSMVVIGGLGSVYGATLGAFLVFGLPELFHGINDWVVLLGTGALLFIVITRLPGGMAGLVQSLRDMVVRSVASLDPEMRARIVQAAGPAGGTRG